MCDTLTWVGDDGVWFAKNSDRPPDEVQPLRKYRPRASGDRLLTQYLDLGTDPGAAGIVAASQPMWLWGFETGINEHRVAIGNEAVYTTDDRHEAPVALLGMDILRLALERSTTAESARIEVCSLVEEHGQGGTGWEHSDEPYFSSFLVADTHEAWIIETSNHSWVARHVPRGGAAISNRLSLSDDWDIASPDITPGTDWQRFRNPAAPTGIADHRLAVTSSVVETEPTFASIANALRNHGADHPSLPIDVEPDWSGVTVCMHVRGYQATTASLIAWLPAEPAEPADIRAALGSPCVSVYVPVRPSTEAFLADPVSWARFARLRDRVEADPTRREALAEVRASLDPVEAALGDGTAGIADLVAALDHLNA